MKSNRPSMGLLFVGCALLCGLVGLGSSIRAANRVRGLRPVTVARLQSIRAGREVLVEGRVSSRNSVRSHGLVAYVRESREFDEEDSVGRWFESARVTPPLLLELQDGLVQISNDDYGLEDPHIIEEAGSFGEPSTTRYKGLEADDPVIAVAIVVDGRERPEIDADLIARGTRASYLARRRRGGVLFCVGSFVVAVLGGTILLWDQVARLLPRRR